MLPVLFLLTAVVGGATPGEAAGQPDSDASPALRDRLGIEFLFNYDFEKADEVYTAFTEEFPDHPFGPYNRASVIWTRLAQKGGGMRGSAHRGDRFWGQKRTPELETVDEVRFREFTETALELAERALERDPEDLDALYYLGATEALISGWKLVVERSYFGAAMTMRRAVGRHQRIQRADAGFIDAYVVPGAYRYGIATLPRALRALVFLLGMRGDRDGGLGAVERTAHEGRRARWGALVTLSILMQREKRYEEALVAVRTLTRSFPRNPDFALEEAGVLISLRRYAEAREVLAQFESRRADGWGNYDLTPAGLAELRLGESLLFEGAWKPAEAAFTAGLRAGPVPELQSLLLFRRGNARDGMGARPAALADYAVAERSDADDVVSGWAKALRKRPWPAGAPEGTAPN